MRGAGLTASGDDSGHVSFDLSGKVAVITGGSRGLGRAISHGLAAHGANVVVASRDGDACASVADEITASTGRRAIGIACHVGHWDDCNRLADTAYEQMGRVDVLVNNAGTAPTYPSVSEVSQELWDKVQQVNLRGPFRLSALIGTRMAAGVGGSIVNISSLAAIRPGATEVPYAAAKAGLNNLTIALAQTFAPKVRVNCIMPGWFLTTMSHAWDQEQFEEISNSAIPLRRGGMPHEIVGAVLYFASSASSYTTGAVLKVDGGFEHAPA